MINETAQKVIGNIYLPHLLPRGPDPKKQGPNQGQKEICKRWHSNQDLGMGFSRQYHLYTCQRLVHYKLCRHPGWHNGKHVYPSGTALEQPLSSRIRLEKENFFIFHLEDHYR